MFRRIPAFLLCLLLCVVPVCAENTPVDPAQQAIADRWQAAQPSPADQPVYETEPSAAMPYAIGGLTNNYLSGGLRYANFLRQLAGLEPVTLSDYLCVQAQYGAVLLAANDHLTHTPEKPWDMGSSFYRMGANACASSNISMRYGYSHSGLLQDSLQGQMDELSALNRLDLGHRRWLLDPKLGQIGFGVAASATDKLYIAVPVSDASGKGIAPSAVCWPAAGQFPNNVFAPGTPWSVSLDPSLYQTPVETQLRITVTRLRDGRQFVPSVLDGQVQLSDEGTYLLISSKAYGTGPCISFSIGKAELGESTYLGDYTVSIRGLYLLDGTETALEYTVRFFDAENLSSPADWALEEVTRAAELGLIPETLTDLYDRPITRLEYCRLAMQALRQKTGLDNAGLAAQYALPGPAVTFTDCADPEVLAAAAIGAVRGMGDGTFRPAEYITRQDAAVLLQQAASALGLNTPADGGLLYSDSALIAEYAQPAVLWASQTRDTVSAMPVMAGMGDGRFDPLGNYTREQAILTILRLFRSEITPIPEI